MSGWGIAETAPVIEKIKAESADYLRGLNSCGEITWSVYDEAFDFYMGLISRAYEQGKQDAQPTIEPERKTGKWIYTTYCSECGWVHETDPGFIGSVDGFNFCPNCGAKMCKDAEA